MLADLIPISQLTPRDLAAWQQLASVARSPNPFAEPGFVLPADRGLRARRLALLVVRKGIDWLAAMPVQHVSSLRGVPGRTLVGWRHLYSYLATPLVAGDDPEATLAALIAGGLRTERCLVLDYVEDDGPLAEPLSRVLAHHGRWVELETFERAILHRRPTDDYLEQAMSAPHRGQLRRARRRLEERVGALTLQDRSADPAEYQRFLELERTGWKGETGSAIAADAGHASFFTEMCGRFSDEGRLELLSLASDQHTVAMKCNLVSGQAGFGFKVASDMSLSRFSPGIQLEAACLPHFHAGTLAWIDSGADADNRTFNRLWPGRRPLRAVVACPRGASGALPYATWTAAAAALLARRRLDESRRQKALSAGS